LHVDEIESLISRRCAVFGPVLSVKFLHKNIHRIRPAALIRMKNASDQERMCVTMGAAHVGGCAVLLIEEGAQPN
jgi:hypothetical protein